MKVVTELDVVQNRILAIRELLKDLTTKDVTDVAMCYFIRDDKKEGSSIDFYFL